MRGIIKAATSAGALAAMLTAGCAAEPSAARTATIDTCFAYGVRAIQLHITVTRVPHACSGLSHEQINEAVARAVREAAGPYPKAVVRQREAEDSRYLVNLVSPIPPSRPAPPIAAPPPTSSNLPVNLAAVLSWIFTVGVGGYLLSGWPRGTRLRRRDNKVATVPQPVIVGHVGFAVAGLATWIAFLSTAVPALAWSAVGMTFAIAGLGMATLITAMPEPGTSSGGGRAPAFVIAIHGILATATILFVLLAAVSAG